MLKRSPRFPLGIFRHLVSVFGDSSACWNNTNARADCIRGWCSSVEHLQDPNSVIQHQQINQYSQIHVLKTAIRKKRCASDTFQKLSHWWFQHRWLVPTSSFQSLLLSFCATYKILVMAFIVCSSDGGQAPPLQMLSHICKHLFLIRQYAHILGAGTGQILQGASIQLTHEPFKTYELAGHGGACL